MLLLQTIFSLGICIIISLVIFLSMHGIRSTRNAKQMNVNVVSDFSDKLCIHFWDLNEVELVPAHQPYIRLQAYHNTTIA